ncbi:hypothetical protein [Pseudomonas alabamensis]|uniref:hypothetical protein n=1 Tax=Pseudomonas alabamensis TaxID=3064349 RepID=UPI0016427AAC
MTLSPLTNGVEASSTLNAGSIHTQGANFLQAVQTGADPRTGQFNLAISIPLGQANQLSGPTWPFTLAYSVLSSQQDSGFGLGWSLLYSRLTREQNIWTLQLSSGEHFSVDLENSDLGPCGCLAFHDYKLHAMQVSLQPIDDVPGESMFRILHKSGDQEFLRRVNGSGSAYVLHELRSPEGRSLYFDWLQANNVLSLRAVRDQQRTLARYDRTQRTLVLEPDSIEPSKIQFFQANGELARLLLPGISTPFAFSYENQAVGDQRLRLPISVTGPLGATDTITWSRTLASSHRLPAKAPIAFMPRVISWLHSDGPSTPVLLRRYTWQGSRNYLGGDSPQGFDWQAGRDSLYRLMTRYEYQNTETQLSGDLVSLQALQAVEQPDSSESQDWHARLDSLVAQGAVTTLTTIKRTWDRHHLLLEEVTLTGACETTREITYGIDYAKHWQDQPAQCQLPHTVKTTWVHTGTKARYSEETTYEYDVFGNTLNSLLPTGVEEVYEYYPALGDVRGCPADASGMARWLKQKTVHPAPGCPGHAPVLCTRFEYEALPSLVANDPAHAVVCLEERVDVTSGQVLERTSQTYERIDPAHYGRSRQTITTLNGKATGTLFEYSITHAADEPALLHTRTVVKGFEDNALATSASEDSRSLLTGLTHCEVSAAGARTRFTYDALGRVIRTVIAEGTAYEAVRTCSYHLDDDFVARQAPRSNDDLIAQVGIEEIDATGQRKRTWFDGSGRTVLVQLEDLDNQPGVFLDVLKVSHDAWGREIERVEQDWLADGSLLSSTTSSTTYDDWGNLYCQTNASGVMTYTAYDPTQRYGERWQQSPTGTVLGKQVTTLNTAGSVVHSALFDDQAQAVRTTDYVRDGLDRVIEQRITPRDVPLQVTQFDYDHNGRLTARHQLFTEDEQPLIRTVCWEYAAHSDGDHPESISVFATSPRSAP